MSESVAVVEKKPQRPGGCAGIFFQLFDWNRRLAKKKLFSKKLLAPAQPKQCERKFGRDEKLPKLRLISGENGFMNMKKRGNGNKDSKQKLQTRSPSLVARLMGLESMPAIQKVKSEETSLLRTDNEGVESTSTENVFGYYSEKDNADEKHETRPQKAQKTSSSERQALTKFKSDVFQFESLLSRSKKHHRTKLVSPLKNPKMSSKKTSSRLIDVASKILEPGLQSTSRAKSAITHSNNPQRNDSVMEREMLSPDIPESSEFYFPTDSACRHCGNQLERLESTPNFEENATPLPFSSSIYSNKIKDIKAQPVPSFEREKWRTNEIYQELPKPDIVQTKYHKKIFSGEGPSNPQRNSQNSIALKHKSLQQSQVSRVRDRVPHQRHRASSVSNDFDHSGKRTPLENSSCNKRSGSLSPVRKRRSMSTNHSSESSIFMSSNVARQSNARCNLVGGNEKEKEIRLDSQSYNSTNRGSTMKRDIKGVNVTSSSKQRVASGVTRSKSCTLSSSVESDEKLNAEKSLVLSGDELGAILQQKLKELSCQEDDEVPTGSEPKRSTAVILQELISALTSEKAVFRDDVAVEYEGKIPYRSPQLPNRRSTFEFQAKQKTVRTLPEDEHPSPGSVLEAPFSNDSCLSSNFSDGSEIYRDGVLKPEPDLVTHVSEVLLSLGFANTGLKQSKLVYAKDVILNMELISKNTNQSSSLIHFLIYELENLAAAMFPEFGPVLDLEDKRHMKKFKEFMFDCLIEYFDTKYGRYTSCRFLPWIKMPLCSIGDELVDEVRKWMVFGEYATDEIIDYEMSHSYGKWNDFEIEEYETGAEIGKDVLQILVDEIVMELLFEGSKVCSKWN